MKPEDVPFREFIKVADFGSIPQGEVGRLLSDFHTWLRDNGWRVVRADA